MRGYPYFSLWIPITLAKIYFFSTLLTFAKIHLYEEAPSLNSLSPTPVITELSLLGNVPEFIVVNHVFDLALFPNSFQADISIIYCLSHFNDRAY